MKQSIYPLRRAMDCFASLAMTLLQHDRVNWNSQRDVGELRAYVRRNFFIIFVDGMFTTFIEWPFTNASDAIRENHAMSCV